MRADGATCIIIAMMEMQSSVIRISIENQVEKYLLEQKRFDPVKMPDITDLESCWQTIADA